MCLKNRTITAQIDSQKKDLKKYVYPTSTLMGKMKINVWRKRNMINIHVSGKNWTPSLLTAHVLVTMIYIWTYWPKHHHNNYTTKYCNLLVFNRPNRNTSLHYLSVTVVWRPDLLLSSATKSFDRSDLTPKYMDNMHWVKFPGLPRKYKGQSLIMENSFDYCIKLR